MGLRERVARLEPRIGIGGGARGLLLRELIEALPSDLLRELAEGARDNGDDAATLKRLHPQLIAVDPRWAAFNPRWEALA